MSGKGGNMFKHGLKYTKSQQFYMDLKLLALTTALTIVAVGSAYFALSQQLGGISTQINSLSQNVSKTYNNQGFSEVAININDSVYSILSFIGPSTNIINSDSFYVDENNLAWSKGTGFAVNDDGLILTACHVINTNGPKQVLVDGQWISANVKKCSTDIDIGLIKIDHTTQPLNIVDNENITIGLSVGFFGYPLSNDVTTKNLGRGTISAITYNGSLRIYNINGFVNHGDSGGPLFLADNGKVIGVITQKTPPSNLLTANENSNLMNQLTAGEKILYINQIQMYNLLVTELAYNSQLGIGIAQGIDKTMLNNIINN
jgi:hypothetical protein